MRATLFAFHMLALAVLVGAAGLIILEVDRAGALGPIVRDAFFGLLGAGAVACAIAGAGLSRPRVAGFRGWTALASVSLALIGAAVVLALAAGR